MYFVRTPCSDFSFVPKRPMDEQFCERFHKRLRINGPAHDSGVCGYPHQAGGHAVLPGASCSSLLANPQENDHAPIPFAVGGEGAGEITVQETACYGQVNSVLQRLHAERASRRPSLTLDGAAAVVVNGASVYGGSSSSSGSMVLGEAEAAMEANSMLHRLHAEQQMRRASLGESSYMVDTEDASSCAAGNMHDSRQCPSSSMMTNFSLTDVVFCNHGTGGRCLQCSGRRVQNVPLTLYSAFSSVFSASSAAAFTSGCSFGLRSELALPSLASLAAILAPEPGERLLHLGSGFGCAAAAWTMMFPGSEACGIESNLALHRAAEALTRQLQPDVRCRMFLHCGDVFESGANGEWRQASVIFVNLGSRSDAESLEPLLDGLQSVEPGTRVVTFSRPLCWEPSRAPAGFALARESLFRTMGSGNCTVFIYRRGSVEA